MKTRSRTGSLNLTWIPDEHQNRLTLSANSQLFRFLEILVIPEIPDDKVTEVCAEGRVYQVFLEQEEIVANEDPMRTGTYLIAPRPQLKDSGNF